MCGNPVLLAGILPLFETLSYSLLFSARQVTNLRRSQDMIATNNTGAEHRDLPMSSGCRVLNGQIARSATVTPDIQTLLGVKAQRKGFLVLECMWQHASCEP